MKYIIRFRWIIMTAWLAILVGMLWLAPDLQKLVAEKGQITIPDGYPAIEAEKLLDNMSSDGEHTTSAVLVFHDKDGIDKAKKGEIAQAIKELDSNKNKLGISEIIDFTEDPQIEEQTVSEDKTTILVPLNVSLSDQTASQSREKIYKTIDHINVDHKLTGELYIDEDIIINSEEGLQKTLVITVILILIILFAVFKSFVAPLIPLLTVGVSYLISEGIVAILANTIGFPLSTFTQIFMVAVMFGIGTDYCILLISRFKEEIGRHDSVKDAVITTYKSGGKTIYYAGLAVLIGFSTIGLSAFSLYQSAVAVAVGVAVVLIALVTLVPFLFVLLGKKLFWPFDKNVEHKESAIWRVAGTFAWKRPIIALLVVAVITVPPILKYNNQKSYDSLAEIGDSYDSVQGFNWIADHFGPGESMPTTVVFETDRLIDSVEEYQSIETITQELARIDGVDQVRSATRPTGEIIDDFLIESQTNQLAGGIGEGNQGISEIQEGMQEASFEMENASPQLKEAKNGVEELMNGTNSAKDGLGDIRTALAEINTGIQSGSAGAGEIKSGLKEVKQHLDQSITGNKELLKGYKAIAEGLAGFGEVGAMNLEEIGQLTSALEGAKQNVTKTRDIAMESNPDLATNEEFLQSYGTVIGQIDGTIEGINQLKENLGQLSNIKTQLQEQVIGPLKELNKGLSETINGQEQLSSGINDLITGMDELQSGLNEAANGQGQVTKHIPDLQDGLVKINGGQKQLKTAFSDMDNQISELSDGLGEGSDGLRQISDGLNQVHDYLDGFNIKSNHPVVVIPEEALDNEEFIEGTKMYLSDDKKTVKFDLILTSSPYSTVATEMVDDIKEKADDAIKDTVFADADPKVGGVTSSNNDLQQISDADYTKTAFLMIAGIFIVLVILLKSLVMPVYLIASLVLTYFASMGFAELIFVNLLGYDGLTWAIPFFSFVMLIALGIDYSIFLMDRFNEYKNGNIKETLIAAMKNMGTVIISATIILGGTFGAMLPSGVLSLLQIATVVLIGLALYAFVMLPLFIPVMVRMFGNANWWPFKNKKETYE